MFPLCGCEIQQIFTCRRVCCRCSELSARQHRHNQRSEPASSAAPPASARNSKREINFQAIDGGKHDDFCHYDLLNSVYLPLPLVYIVQLNSRTTLHSLSVEIITKIKGGGGLLTFSLSHLRKHSYHD